MSGELVFDLYSLAVAHSLNETERQSLSFETLATPASALIYATTCATSVEVNVFAGMTPEKPAVRLADGSRVASAR